MKLIIATNNAGKLAEFKRILAPMNIEVSSASEEGVFINPEETGTTFKENAWIKANALYQATGQPSVADDSGLETESLGGAPGIYSARYAGEGATDEQNIHKLLEDLRDEKNRKARFVSVICYINSKGKAHYATGSCEGEIAYKPIGNHGFGYDPIFLVGDRSFAQLTAEEKDSISHRAKAMEEFISKIGEWE